MISFIHVCTVVLNKFGGGRHSSGVISTLPPVQNPEYIYVFMSDVIEEQEARDVSDWWMSSRAQLLPRQLLPVRGRRLRICSGHLQVC